MFNSLGISSTILLIFLSGFYCCIFLYLITKLQKLYLKFLPINEEIALSLKEFNEFYNSDLYFSIVDFHKWSEKWKHLTKYLKQYQNLLKSDNIIYKIPFVKQFLKNNQSYNKLKEYEAITLELNEIFEKGTPYIEERNEEFIKNEIKKFDSFFKSIEDYELNISQKRAIIIDEYRNLVIASAGSGKTSTIMGKAGYLIKKGLANSDEILFLAFTNKAKDEMVKRIKKRFDIDLEVRTFHSLGRYIIGEVEGSPPIVADILGDKDKLLLQDKIQELFKNRIGLNKTVSLDDFLNQPDLVKFEADKQFLETVNKFFVFNLKPYKSILEFKTMGEYIDYIKNNQIYTLNGEIVKSYEEMEIANYLFYNGIEYEYEKDYEYNVSSEGKKKYQPDFYLTNYGIYIEHFGVTRDNKTAEFIDNVKYLEKMEWKREKHKENNTTLIETYSYEKMEGSLLENLKNKLQENKIQFQPINSSDLFNRINRLGIVYPFIKLLISFLELYKQGNYTLDELKSKIEKYQNKPRYYAFLDVFYPIYQDYQKYLETEKRIDFSDMINQAIEYVSSNQFLSKYKYILVDEFQDVSKNRYQLLNQLLNQKENSKIFTVGDDWQSIYRFAGSDISIIAKFQSYFGLAKTSVLSETFRFPDKLMELSSKFIMQNPNQIPKQIQTQKKTHHPSVTIKWIDSDYDLYGVLKDINSIEKDASIQIIGRYWHLEPQNLAELQGSFTNLRINYITAHSSKGTESDYVILIGLEKGKFGFPSNSEDDPILNLVLTEEETHPFAEERRVFYVAITRAKKHVFMLVDKKKPSSFVTEILSGDYEVNVIGDNGQIVMCPECKTGIIVLRTGVFTPFFSCNNFPYCNYKPYICQKCNDGFLKISEKNPRNYICTNENCSETYEKCPDCGGYLVPRVGYSKFLGCINCPNCGYTRPIYN